LPKLVNVDTALLTCTAFAARGTIGTVELVLANAGQGQLQYGKPAIPNSEVQVI
jgi:hypothetical protein